MHILICILHALSHFDPHHQSMKDIYSLYIQHRQHGLDL